MAVTRRTRGSSDAPARHDPGYKRIFSHATMVKELLRGFVHEGWIEKLDFSTLERVGNSFVSGDLRERHSDLIWRLRLHGDGDRWIYLYLLLEFQSTSDPFMAVRLLTYVGLLLEEIIQKEKLRPGDRLPAVLPLVIHSGRDRWRAPLRLETHFAPVPKDLKRYLPRLTYLLLDERRLDLDRPELERNPTAAFFQVEVNETAEALLDLYQQLKGRIPPEEAELQRFIDAWFWGVVQRIAPGAIIQNGLTLEGTSMLEENLIRWRDQARNQGRREGLKEGLKEGRLQGEVLGLRRALLKLMAERFGRLPKEVRSQVQQISSTQDLEKLTRKVLSAESLEDLSIFIQKDHRD